MTLVITAVVAVATAAALAATAAAREQAEALVVYSGRDEAFVKPLFDRFTKATGIEVKARYGDSAELAATILEEGRNSPADVFFSQDAGAAGAVANDGLLIVLPKRVLEKVPAKYRARRWVGVSGRARVVAYNTDARSATSLPKTIWGYTAPRWKGKIGFPPTNASFQAFVTAMRLSAGDSRTRQWLLGIKANEPKLYARNSAVLTALASREVEVGFVNHYYLYQLKASKPDAPVANLFLGRGDPGALVNVASAGIVKGTQIPGRAMRLIEYLLSREGQRYYTSGTNAEYPLIKGVPPRSGLPSLESIERPDIALGRLGRNLPKTLELMNDVCSTR